ncbi:hypothetical protein CDAR_123141, partial [Caerostris darwini]
MKVKHVTVSSFKDAPPANAMGMHHSQQCTRYPRLGKTFSIPSPQFHEQ